MSHGLRILVVSQFFSPEMGAPAARFHDFGRLLLELGHQLTVVTGFPNSPSGIVPQAYRGRLLQRETLDGIELRRGWLFTSPRLTPTTKTLGFATFAASASLWALLGRLRADVVIGTSPPPTAALPALLAARRMRVPLIFDIRDIWPEAIANSGRLSSGTMERFLEGMQSLLCREASRVTVVTEGKRERMIEKGVPAEKLSVIPNGVDLARFDTRAPVDDILRKHGVRTDRFLVVYAGILNPAQGLDVLLDAARALRTRLTSRRVQFVLVGAGMEGPRLEQRRHEEALENDVAFVPEQPRERIASLLRRADAVVVPLRKRRDTHTVPSKLYEAIASGRPVLVSADGAPPEIVRDAGAGLATPAEDVEGLVESVERLVESPELCEKLGRAGAEYASRFDRRRIAESLAQLLEEVVRTPDPRGSSGESTRGR